jgi:hypothetical protein
MLLFLQARDALVPFELLSLYDQPVDDQKTLENSA